VSFGPESGYFQQLKDCSLVAVLPTANHLELVLIPVHWCISWNSQFANMLGLCECQSRSHITTDSQSASQSWCQAPIRDQWVEHLPWGSYRSLNQVRVLFVPYSFVTEIRNFRLLWLNGFVLHRNQICYLSRYKQKTKLRGLSPRANYTDRAIILSTKLVQTFFGQSVPRGQRDGSLQPYSRISGPEPLLFLSSSSSIVLRRLSGPRSRPSTSQKIW
jgi:hypothetical protein